MSWKDRICSSQPTISPVPNPISTSMPSQLCGMDFGKFMHNRTPTPLDRQTVIRMNRDTLYSGAVFDLDGTCHHYATRQRHAFHVYAIHQ
jgi:hypothetical protein